MDVQAAPQVGATVVSGSTASAPTSDVSSTHSSAPATQVAQVAQPAQTDANANHAQGSGIAPAIAKLFGGGVPQPIQLNVSYRVEGNDVVTVFTDPATHKEVAQFPPELLIGLAKFFDQQSGVTFDQNA